MLDKQDIVQLRGVFQEVLVQNNADLKVEIRDEMRSLLVATENRIMSEMRERIGKVHSNMHDMEKRIVHGISEVLDASILPQIAELQQDMTKVKIHLQLA